MNMQNWKAPNGTVHGIDADDPAQLAILARLQAQIPGTWTNVTGNWPPPTTAAQLRQPLVNAAAQQLAAAEKIAIRCFMAGLPFPPAWQAHAKALRDIRDGVDLSSSALPPDPPTIAGI